MTNIEIKYTPNAKGKYDFSVTQNGNLLYEKTYSPVKSKNQHYMGMAQIAEMQATADRELEINPNFMWADFEEFKSWAGNPELLNRAVARYHEEEAKRIEENNK